MLNDEQRPVMMQDRIQAAAFPGDNDSTLKNVQVLLHFDLIRWLEEKARKRYLEAADIVGLENELVQRMKQAVNLDPRPLEPAYGMIAAFYRFQTTGSCQMELGQDSAAHWEMVKNRWVDFYREKVERLTQDGRITRAIVQAVVQSHISAREEAEEALEVLLEDRYGNLELKARGTHRVGKA